MKFNPKALPITSKALFTIVGGAVLINPVFAQEQASEELEEVVVTGLRGSLKASMETKRDALGVVDAINAEDIGKFPDTNLSEALQRITGVSIDRRNGEGALVTARGFGPQFNMVTLNGRQMPAADAYRRLVMRSPAAPAATHAPSTSPIWPLKRSMRSRSTRPVVLTSPPAVSARRSTSARRVRSTTTALVLNLGVKAINDTTNRVGDDFTPEVLGHLQLCQRRQDVRRRRVGQLCRSATAVRRASTVNDWHIQPWDSRPVDSMPPIAPALRCM